MRKAYDTFLQSEVSADLASKSGGLEQYRYECAHCGEEVRLAAVSSMSMASHFRHRSGNNDVECEKYLGQYGTISTDSHSRKSKNERAEFYFDNITKMFNLGLCFSEDEIAAYEQEITTFELSASAQEQAFYSLCINNRNFDPGVTRMIPIERFSYNYFLSNTLNGVKRKYELFKLNDSNTPTFFKIQGNDSNFKAKLVRSSVLYTNVPYFVAFQNQYSFPRDYYIPSDIEVVDTFYFETMGRKFLGKIIIIKDKTTCALLMSKWGYQLEASETLTLLWPPAVTIDDVSRINADCAFLFSGFELEAYGNINVQSTDIKKIADCVSMVSLDSRIKVYRKNAEIVIDKAEEYYTGFDSIPIAERHENVYTVQDNSTYFLFNRSGTTLINHGQSVFLTPGNLIRHYHCTYLDGLIYPMQQCVLSGEQLLNDILVYYKRTDKFSIDVFDSLVLSEVASHYIEGCKESGLINSAALRFIKEGWL